MAIVSEKTKELLTNPLFATQLIKLLQLVIPLLLAEIMLILTDEPQNLSRFERSLRNELEERGINAENFQFLHAINTETIHSSFEGFNWNLSCLNVQMHFVRTRTLRKLMQ